MKTLFLAWQDPNTRAWFPIGRLTYDGKEYEFIYTRGIEKAQAECGFQGLYSFPELNKVYTSNELFPLFSNRVMRRSRPDYKNYIEWLNIPQNEDEPATILSRSGGQKATDSLEVFPCPTPDENGFYHVHFFAHGLRHLPSCAIERILKFENGELLYLAHEFQNPWDSNALSLCTQDHHHVGYCPRYITSDLFQLIEKHPKLVKVQVERVNPAPTPLQLRLLCHLTAEWHDTFSPFSTDEYQPLVTPTRRMFAADVQAG